MYGGEIIYPGSHSVNTLAVPDRAVASPDLREVIRKRQGVGAAEYEAANGCGRGPQIEQKTLVSTLLDRSNLGSERYYSTFRLKGSPPQLQLEHARAPWGGGGGVIVPGDPSFNMHIAVKCMPAVFRLLTHASWVSLEADLKFAGHTLNSI